MYKPLTIAVLLGACAVHGALFAETHEQDTHASSRRPVPFFSLSASDDPGAIALSDALFDRQLSGADVLARDEKSAFVAIDLSAIVTQEDDLDGISINVQPLLGHAGLQDALLMVAFSVDSESTGIVSPSEPVASLTHLAFNEQAGGSLFWKTDPVILQYNAGAGGTVPGVVPYNEGGNDGIQRLKGYRGGNSAARSIHRADPDSPSFELIVETTPNPQTDFLSPLVPIHAYEQLPSHYAPDIDAITSRASTTQAIPSELMYVTYTSDSPSLVDAGISGADILIVSPEDPAADPLLYAKAHELGLDFWDDIDALVVFDAGALGVFDEGDVVVFSLSRYSPSLDVFPSGSAAAVYLVHAGASAPELLLDSAQFGLLGSDNLDALDLVPVTSLEQASEFIQRNRIQLETPKRMGSEISGSLRAFLDCAMGHKTGSPSECGVFDHDNNERLDHKDLQALFPH